MASSLGHSERHIRLVYFLSNGCAQLARSVCEKLIEQSKPIDHDPTGDAWSLSDFRALHMATLSGMRNREQRKQLMHATTVEEWDISILCFVIVTCTGDMHLKLDFNQLKVIRDTIYHINPTEVDEPIYERHVQMIEVIVQRCCTFIDNADVTQEMNTLLDHFKKGEITTTDQNYHVFRQWYENDPVAEFLRKVGQLSAEHKVIINKLDELKNLCGLKGFVLPDTNVELIVKNCSSDKEKLICEQLVKLMNPRLKETLTDADKRGVCEAAKEAMAILLSGGRELTEAYNKCVVFKVKCPTFENMRDLWIDCMTGQMTGAFDSLEKCFRKQTGMADIVFDIGITQFEIYRCFESTVNGMVQTLLSKEEDMETISQLLKVLDLTPPTNANSQNNDNDNFAEPTEARDDNVDTGRDKNSKGGVNEMEDGKSRVVLRIQPTQIIETDSVVDRCQSEQFTKQLDNLTNAFKKKYALDDLSIKVNVKEPQCQQTATEQPNSTRLPKGIVPRSISLDRLRLENNLFTPAISFPSVPDLKTLSTYETESQFESPHFLRRFRMNDLPIHRGATRHGLVDTLKCLMDQGADVNSKDMIDDLTIHIATRNGHVECLMDHGADVNSKVMIYSVVAEMVKSNRVIVRQLRTIITEGTQCSCPCHDAPQNNDKDRQVQQLDDKINEFDILIRAYLDKQKEHESEIEQLQLENSDLEAKLKALKELVATIEDNGVSKDGASNENNMVQSESVRQRENSNSNEEGATSDGSDQGATSSVIVKRNFQQHEIKGSNSDGQSTQRAKLPVDSVRKMHQSQERFTFDLEWRLRAQTEKDRLTMQGLRPVTGTATVLVVDVSASMLDGGAWNHAHQFVMDYLHGLELMKSDFGLNEDNVALAIFGNENGLVERLTNNYDWIKTAFSTLIVGGPSPIYGGLLMSGLAFCGTKGFYNVGSLPVYNKVVLITDGNPTDTCKIAGPDTVTNPTHVKRERDILQLCEGMRSDAIDFYCVPCGNANMDFLSKMVEQTDGKMIKHTQGTWLSKRLWITFEAVKNRYDIYPFAQPGRTSDEKQMEMIDVVLRSRKIQDEQKEKLPQDMYRDTKNSNLPPVGSRVERGPDWRRGDIDKNGPGTVIGHSDKAGVIWVHWDLGGQVEHRYGSEGKYEVLLTEKHREVLVTTIMAVGCEVVPGPQMKVWDFSLKRGMTGVAIRLEQLTRVVQVKWSNGERGSYSYRVGNQEVILSDRVVYTKDGARKVEAPVETKPKSKNKNKNLRKTPP